MREGERPDHGPNISPSSRGQEGRSLAAANFPPLDPQGKGPSESDRHLSNAEIQEIATIVAAVMKKEKRWYSGPLLFASGILVGVGASVAVDRVYGDEPIPEPVPASRDIGSAGPTSLTDDSLIDDRLPRSEVETKQVNPDEVLTDKVVEQIRNSNPNAIKAKKFDITPPNRTPSEDMSSQYIPIDRLPTIKEYTAEYSRDGTYNNFQTGVGFVLEERTETYVSRRVTPNGLEPIKQEFTRYPIIGVNGYVIGKEIDPDGNVLLAVYAPGKKGLSNPEGIENSSLVLENMTNEGNKGLLSNAIVWLKLENWIGYSPPFYSNANWRREGSIGGGGPRNAITTIPEELFRYIEIGDPVSGGGMAEIPPWAEEMLIENYKERENHITYEEAREKFLNVVKSNSETSKRVLQDAKTGGVSLEEQFATKRYVMQVIGGIRFVPRD